MSGRCVGEACRGGVMGWVEEVGGRGGMRAWGVRGARRGVCGACVCAWACVGRACCAISVGIARSALLSGYLGKSGHLPR